MIEIPPSDSASPSRTQDRTERTPSRTSRPWRRWAVVGPPLLWLALFCLLPLLFVVRISFSEVRMAIPPYRPLIERTDEGELAFRPATGNYRRIVDDSLYLRAFMNSLRVAGMATFLTLVAGYAMAYAIVGSPARRRPALLLLVVLPFWTSFLIRTYAWIGILKREGWLNSALQHLGLIAEPLTLLYTESAVVLGIVYAYLPFMILPIYASLDRVAPEWIEAAEDLGSRPFRTFWKITFPLSLPGVTAGCFLVFLPSIGEFVIPDLLGGSGTLLIGQLIWTEFFSNRDWPVAAALSVVLLAVLAVPFFLLYRATPEDQAGPSI